LEKEVVVETRRTVGNTAGTITTTSTDIRMGIMRVNSRAETWSTAGQTARERGRVMVVSARRVGRRCCFPRWMPGGWQ
jgi:hypothetical protein